MTTNVQNQVNTVTQTTAAHVAPATTRDTTNSIMLRLAQKFGVNSNDLYRTLANTCFKVKEGEAYRTPSQEELISLLLIAEKVGLNPFMGEIYAFPNNGGIVPIVGINGWRTIAACKPEYAGVRFEFSPELSLVDGIEAPRFVSCFVKVRRPDGFVFESQGTVFFKEKYQSRSPAWKSQPCQMLMNKAQIQALKNAFPSCGGLYDEDDGRSIAFANDMASAAPAVSQATPQTDRTVLQHTLKKVIAMAQQRNAWPTAIEWVMKKTEGANQTWALEEISKARALQISEAKAATPEAIEVKEPTPRPAPTSVVKPAATAVPQQPRSPQETLKPLAAPEVVEDEDVPF